MVAPVGQRFVDAVAGSRVVQWRWEVTVLLWTWATAMAVEPAPEAPKLADDAQLSEVVDVAEPPEAEALRRALSMRHAVPCAELEAGLQDPVAALQWAVVSIPQPPWAAMHAAECLAVGHGDVVAADLERWVTDPALKGLGMQTLGLLPHLSEGVAVQVTRAALAGELADRATRVARDDERPAVQALLLAPVEATP